MDVGYGIHNSLLFISGHLKTLGVLSNGDDVSPFLNDLESQKLLNNCGHVNAKVFEDV